MTYIKWKCTNCGDIKVSNSLRRHTMDTCKCGLSSLDLEEDYARMVGGYKFIKKYNYNFFDEIVICLIQQGFHEGFIDIGESKYISYVLIDFIRNLEDKIIREIEI